ncbi:packaged DNA stabilization protein [Bradyrhizobium sp. dw_78]|uniref:packaged DNA stabilization protein n=1 Tax=Bradyrhizobium sp. dw_78 TaxID=2719793 RepID=UPI001BD52C96|nr:packaged DNA stabilization protein [Bradyrhizobium sp. dw_78]
MPIIPFATNSYRSDSLPVSAQRAVNVYAEKEPQDAKNQVAVFGAPGLTAFSNCGAGPVRGMHVMNGVLYIVSGPTLYSIAADGTCTALGGQVSGTNLVSISDNGTQICIVNGVNGYIYGSDIGFTIISDPNFHAAKTVSFFDDVFVFDWLGTNKFFLSNQLDGTTYNGLAFASAEVAPDFVLSTVNQQENLMIFGGSTIELWFDAGTANMPFQRLDGGVIERGCAAAMTPVKEDNTVFFLGEDLIFYRLNGVIPERVSTHAIEAEWRKYHDVTDAYTFSYTWNGHKFIVLTFVSANATWVYDVATGLWHERESFDANNRSYGRWRGNCQANCYGLQLIGDAFSGTVGYLDESAYTEFGNMMQGYMVSPYLQEDRKRIFVSRFELDVETGVGVTTGQGSDPQVMLQWSKDGGRTFSDLQLWHSAGKIGDYLTRLRWLRLGQARQWCFKVTISDPVRRTIIANSVDVSAGM